MSKVSKHLKEQIENLVKNKLDIIFEALPIQNGYYAAETKKIRESETITNGKIERHLKNYEELIFKIRAIEWEIQKKLNELEPHYAFEKFQHYQMVILSTVEKEYIKSKFSQLTP